ncbi:MAG: DUF3810 family protein [Saprospiraceae bacterium]|nr:DUF3810 family protein [Saprospiraceae bacterium]
MLFAGALLVFVTALLTKYLYSYFENSGGFILNFYLNHFFWWYRKSWDFIFAGSPVALSLVWLTFVLLLILYGLYLKIGNKLSWLHLFLSTFILISIHYIWFYWAWGFNYNRPNPWIVSKVPDSIFYKEINDHLLYSGKLRATLDLGSSIFDKSIHEQKMRKALQDYLTGNGIKAVGKPRCRYLYPEGSLLVWSTSGVYVPFTGESLLDPGLHVLAQAFTIPHELAHAFGVTNEAVCNFLAYKVCSQSEDPLIRYAAAFNYLKYLLADLRRKNNEMYREVYTKLNALLIKDLADVRNKHDQYPELFPSFRDWIYDFYLKKHGMPEGEFTYNQMVSLVIADKKKQFSN